MEKDGLSAQQKDALAEVGNIALGSAATALSQIINKRVQITTPRVTLVTLNDVRANFPKPCVVVTVNYLKGLSGENVFIIKEEDALFIVGLMMGMEPPERPASLGELELSAVSEAMNQMMGSAATALADLFLRPIDISPPQVEYKDLQSENVGLADGTSLLAQVAFRMTVDDFLDSELLQLIPIDYGRQVASSLLAGISESAPEDKAEEAPGFPKREQEEDFFRGEESAALTEDVLGDAENIFAAQEAQTIPTFEKREANYSNIEYENSEKINLIKDIPVEISVVLGKRGLSLKNIFSLLPGDIVTLDNYLGEPVELFVNERLVARGEVVLVNGQFGVKITGMLRSE